MSLSSSTLIHLTNEKDKLKKILKEKFRIYNCTERVLVDSDEKSNNTLGYVAPMVSFCDIPLSEVESHIVSYGNYGLGLTKDWGIRMGLNPVLYVNDKSNLSRSYKTAYRHIVQDNSNKFTNEKKAIVDVLRYIKNYEGDLIRKGKIISSNYRFSDEREWRYVPSYEKDCDVVLSIDDYNDALNKKNSDDKLKKIRLQFTPNDIKYIIISDESEIKEFIDYLKCLEEHGYLLHDIERLTTRIITCTQIKEDM